MNNFKILNKAYNGGDLNIEYLRWRTEEEHRFLALKFRENLKLKYELDMLGEAHSLIKAENEDLRLKLKEKKAREAKNNWVFITISPKPAIKFDEFKTICTKFAQRKMFNTSWLVFEQRGDNIDEVGKGFHAHIECERNIDYKPSQVVRNTQNTFKHIVDLKVKQTLHIQHHGDDYHKDKMEYILGAKTDDGKDKKQLMDIKFRELNNLNVCYNYAQKENESVETS